MTLRMILCGGMISGCGAVEEDPDGCPGDEVPCPQGPAEHQFVCISPGVACEYGNGVVHRETDLQVTATQDPDRPSRVIVTVRNAGPDAADGLLVQASSTETIVQTPEVCRAGASAPSSCDLSYPPLGPGATTTLHYEIAIDSSDSEATFTAWLECQHPVVCRDPTPEDQSVVLTLFDG